MEEVIAKIVAGFVAFFSAFLLWDRKRAYDRQLDLEARVRTLEQESVRESRVRQLIEDAVSPLKEIQTEMKADLKELLRLSYERRERHRHDD